MRSQRVSKTLSLYPKSIFSNFGICGVNGCFWNLESEVLNLYRRGTMKDAICCLLFPTRLLQASQDPSVCQLSVQRDCPHWETAAAVQVLCSFPHSCNALSPSFCQQGRSEEYITCLYHSLSYILIRSTSFFQVSSLDSKTTAVIEATILKSVYCSI